LEGGSSGGEVGPDRYRAFQGAAAVVEMAAQLSNGALTMLDADILYAAAALIRQLLETEYLVTAFAFDLSTASTWVRATPEQVRRSFEPRHMRKVGGFSNAEYRQHCSMGGHPSPRGRALLSDVGRSTATTSLMNATAWGDLAQHLRRLWSNVNDLLVGHHARYGEVRAREIDTVGEIENLWVHADPLAEPVNFALLA
jgi:hypothetical protein